MPSDKRQKNQVDQDIEEENHLRMSQLLVNLLKWKDDADARGENAVVVQGRALHEDGLLPPKDAPSGAHEFGVGLPGSQGLFHRQDNLSVWDIRFSQGETFDQVEIKDYGIGVIGFL
ncbi:hypothetical protein [Desulfococcus sp.]|uniref:hypothetical protein n=1 Tax=Desulfococcus sp. TaxID=2025834 RepID=UPI0035944C7F